MPSRAARLWPLDWVSPSLSMTRLSRIRVIGRLSIDFRPAESTTMMWACPATKYCLMWTISGASSRARLLMRSKMGRTWVTPTACQS